MSTRVSGDGDEFNESPSPGMDEEDLGVAPVPPGFDLRALDPKDWKVTKLV